MISYSNSKFRVSSISCYYSFKLFEIINILFESKSEWGRRLVVFIAYNCTCQIWNASKVYHMDLSGTIDSDGGLANFSSVAKLKSLPMLFLKGTVEVSLAILGQFINLNVCLCLLSHCQTYF